MAMRRLAIVMLFACVTASPSAQRSGTVTISIIATTDLHGGVLPRGDRGGIAMFGGYLQNVRAARMRDGGGVLLVDSGDMFQGTLESNLNEGAAVVRAYNVLGYTAAAIGNHEFDFGPVGADETPRTAAEDPRGALKARAAQARFPFLAANTIDDATGKPVGWPNVRPSMLATVRGVKVGVIGVTTKDTAAQTIAANIVGLTFAPLVPSIVNEATMLRARGATIIVVLAHAGGRCTKTDDPEDLTSCDQMAEIVDVARHLPAGLVDVIAAGHTHQAMAQDFGGTTVVEAYANGRSFSRVDITVNGASGAIATKQVFAPQDLVTGRYEGHVVRPNAAVNAAIAPAVRRAMTLKTQPLGVVLATTFPRGDQQDETALADLITDGMLASVPSADVAIGNGGSLRTDLPAGPLTYGEIYELYPFDNRLVTLAMSGDQLTRIIAYNLTRRALPTELLPIAGFRVDAACESGALHIVLTRSSGAPIRADEQLSVLTSDFVAGGGDGILAPAGALPPAQSVEGAPLLRESVVAWFRTRGGRLDANEYVSAVNRRWHFPASRPVMCS